MLKHLKHAFRVVKAHVKRIRAESKRSPHWHTIKNEFLVTHPTCEATGSTAKLQVHHVLPFHLFPELELADGTGRFCQKKNADGSFVCNFIVLSEESPVNAHLHFGHGGNFSGYVANVRDIAARALRLTKAGHPLDQLVKDAKAERKFE